jgi:hypothetical protein
VFNNPYLISNHHLHHDSWITTGLELILEETECLELDEASLDEEVCESDDGLDLSEFNPEVFSDDWFSVDEVEISDTEAPPVDFELFARKSSLNQTKIRSGKASYTCDSRSQMYKKQAKIREIKAHHADIKSLYVIIGERLISLLGLLFWILILKMRRIPKSICGSKNLHPLKKH